MDGLFDLGDWKMTLVHQRQNVIGVCIADELKSKFSSTKPFLDYIFLGTNFKEKVDKTIQLGYN